MPPCRFACCGIWTLRSFCWRCRSSWRPDLPLLGWAGAAVGWTLQRTIQHAIEKRARESDDPRTVAGLLTGSMIARGWIVAGSIFIVGLAEREAGLAAAILSITLFTFYFTSQMLTRPFEEKKS